MFKRGQFVYLPDGRRGKVLDIQGEFYLVKGIHISKPFLLKEEQLKPRPRRHKHKDNPSTEPNEN